MSFDSLTPTIGPIFGIDVPTSSSVAIVASIRGGMMVLMKFDIFFVVHVNYGLVSPATGKRPKGVLMAHLKEIFGLDKIYHS